jgi:hypothetical protein
MTLAAVIKGQAGAGDRGGTPGLAAADVSEFVCGISLEPPNPRFRPGRGFKENWVDPRRGRVKDPTTTRILAIDIVSISSSPAGREQAATPEIEIVYPRA